MKIIELRIGNIVGFKNRTDCYCVVTDLSSAGGIHLIRKFYDGDEDDQPEVIDDITPIPLTEEWLLKFGFKKADKKLDIYPESFILDNIMESRLYLRPSYQGGYYWGFLTESFIDGGYEKDHEFYDNRPMLYVHQLQNLYFALTGEELTIL